MNPLVGGEIKQLGNEARRLALMGCSPHPAHPAISDGHTGTLVRRAGEAEGLCRKPRHVQTQTATGHLVCQLCILLEFFKIGGDGKRKIELF